VLVKSNQEEDALRNRLPAGVSVDIDTDDVSQTGTIIGVICAVVAFLSFSYILILLLPLKWPKSHERLSTSTLVIQYGSLGFFALWLFTVQIPFVVFFRTHSAQVQAFIGRVEVPPQLLSGTERLLGVDPTYKSKFYLKLLAILPWFTFLFTVIAAVVSFVAYRRTKGRAQDGEK